MRKVYRLIRQLGVTSKYKGYYYVAEAVRMFMEIQDHPIKITKDIYPSLAKQFNIEDWKAGIAPWQNSLSPHR